jgi:hypothetical protein
LRLSDVERVFSGKNKIFLGARCGSTTAAVPVVSSPIMEEGVAQARQIGLLKD